MPSGGHRHYDAAQNLEGKLPRLDGGRQHIPIARDGLKCLDLGTEPLGFGGQGGRSSIAGFPHRSRARPRRPRRMQRSQADRAHLLAAAAFFLRKLRAGRLPVEAGEIERGRDGHFPPCSSMAHMAGRDAGGRQPLDQLTTRGGFASTPSPAIAGK